MGDAETMYAHSDLNLVVFVSNLRLFDDFIDGDCYLVAATLQRQKKRKTVEEATVPEPSEYRCLVRATDGKKKISCSVTCL